MSETNPAAGYTFRGARAIYRELQTTAARCRDERVKELRLYINQTETTITKAREQVAQLPEVIAEYQREIAALENIREVQLLELVAAANSADGITP